VSDADAGEGIPAEVVLVESLGADSYVHAALDGSDASFVARTEGYDSRRPGTNVRLRIDPSKIYAFDPETEERLGGSAPPSGSPDERVGATHGSDTIRWNQH
jgi:multiple sugar transport system ATP-binding protein